MPDRLPQFSAIARDAEIRDRSQRSGAGTSAIEGQACYNLRMTLMTVTYELQNPLGAGKLPGPGEIREYLRAEALSRGREEKLAAL